MISIILGLIIASSTGFFIFMSYYAKRLTEMKDEKATEKIISNKNIAQGGMIQYMIYPTVIFALSFVIGIFF